jgi:hypothetical protein
MHQVQTQLSLIYLLKINTRPNKITENMFGVKIKYIRITVIHFNFAEIYNRLSVIQNIDIMRLI